jgi:hypothetical protein
MRPRDAREGTGGSNQAVGRSDRWVNQGGDGRIDRWFGRGVVVEGGGRSCVHHLFFLKTFSAGAGGSPAFAASAPPLLASLESFANAHLRRCGNHRARWVWGRGTSLVGRESITPGRPVAPRREHASAWRGQVRGHQTAQSSILRSRSTCQTAALLGCFC